ncbi:MAG TPA: HEAT repeat domain-containing protein, partial [Gemmatimonadales bacterium]|nr:HEAT repeat domain-containing protein [Gemmatimonadales bacterium]
ISHQFLRLLHKLAHHAEYGPDRVRNEAAGALRQQVAQLAAGWALDDPNPAGYTAVLEQMGRDRPWDVVPGTALEAEPEDVLRIALEVGTAGPRVVAAADALAARGRLGALLELLVAAPPGEARDALWRHVATPERLRANVAGETGDRHIAELLAMRLGSEAIGPLLDALAAAEQRATRAWLLRFLTRFGEAAAAGAAARLDGAPWFVQRNFLVLIHRIGEWPPGFTPEPYLAHSQPAVRHEAVKLALAREDLRTSSLLAALGDPDPRVVALGIRASCIECPPAAVPALEALATDPRFDDEVRARAVRALGRSRTEGARARLVELAVTRRRWLPARLAPKSPLVLEALAALGAYWKDDPAAAEVVDMALRHPDPAYAAAARRIA